MAIIYNLKSNAFTLECKDSMYVIGIFDNKFLTTLYYGKKVEILHPERLMQTRELGFSPSPQDYFYKRSVSLDTLLLECPTYGYGDFRTPAITVEQKDGSRCLDLRYKCYEILSEKPQITGMPSVHDDGNVDTLKITLKDELTNVEVDLYYNVYSNRNVITRHLVIRNEGKDKVVVNKALSASFDLYGKDYNFLDLYGTHCMERQEEIVPLRHGITRIDSTRGSSSHQMNPFMAIMSKDADEYNGEVYGLNLVYSGSFEGNVEVSQRQVTRIQLGINSFDFAWPLKEGEKFETPEVVIVYSNSGLNAMSLEYHNLYNECLIRKYDHPIIINNWEATYFNFNEEKLKALIKSAKGLGIDTFVLDDGWFGHRDNDESSLGDWFVHKSKLPDGLMGISNYCKENGLNFGLWFEPEMISVESELYKKHPDYAIKLKGREHIYSRCQLVLNLAKKEVCDYIIDSISKIIDQTNIKYIKWDFNRNITETQSKDLGHKYVLGLYYVLDTLVNKYPQVMIEGCSGGGGRFDPGMLAYNPQIWTSDDSDAIQRLFIQYGTSIVYPPTCMVGHVSICPNHQTGRVTPFKTRGVVAMSANFGYELNPQALTEQEREMVKEQTKTYKSIRKVIYNSDFYRIRNPFKGNDCAWAFVSKNKKEFYAMYVRILNGATNEFEYLKLKGLDENKIYENVDTHEKYSGGELMNVGLLLPRHPYDFNSILYHFKESRD